MGIKPRNIAGIHMKNIRHYAIIFVLIAVATLILRVFFVNFLFILPRAASAEAGPIDTMFDAHFWMISFLFALIMVPMLYSAFVFRRKPGDMEDGPHIHSNTTLEITWTIVPVIAVVSFGVWGATMLNQLTAVNPAEMKIHAQAQQWAWKFQYPTYANAASGQLVLPVNQPIVMEMNASDVLHSFWVPEFRVKQDLVPGRTTFLRFTPTVVGDYILRCAEICGRDHSIMLADVRVLSATDFAAWADEISRIPFYGDLTPEERGAIWYETGKGFGCQSCHTIDGSAGNGPTWLNLYGSQQPLTDGSTVTADDAYLLNSIINPASQIVAGFTTVQMPANFADQFAAKQQEIKDSQGVEVDIAADLVAYIKSLKQ